MVTISPPLSHVHAAVSDGEYVLAGTHDGVHRIHLRTGESFRVGSSASDFMAFAGNPDSQLVASGHAGPDSSLPDPMGLLISQDGAENWSPISLGGEVDFHGLAIADGNVAGWDTRGVVLWSTDGGKTWQEGPRINPTSLSWFEGRVWMAVPGTGIVVWDPLLAELQHIDEPAVLLAASPEGDALWRLDSDGSVLRTLDGESWTQLGSLQRIEAFTATSDVAYGITGTSVESVTDGAS